MLFVDDAVGFPQSYRKQEASDSGICSTATRIKTLRNTCRELGLANGTIPWSTLAGKYWIVDDIHKIFYCIIPKAASHSLRKLLAEPIIGQLNASVLYPMRNYLTATGFRYLYEIPESERHAVLSEYLKMIVVRHPMDRLRSAYTNKLEKPGGLNKQVLHTYLELIDQHLRLKGRLENNSSFNPMNETITFQDFIELITNYDGQFSNEHWLSYEETCQPCLIDYDVIMRVETLDTDVTALYPRLRYHGDTKPLTHENAREESFNLKLKTVRKAFEKVQPDIVDRILKIYERDFKMFGYHWNNKKGATCELPSDKITKTCC
jgi:hypothetical protein